MDNLWPALWRRSAERGEFIRTLRTTGVDGRWFRASRLGSAALTCVLSALLWLVIAPAAWADSGPTLTDAAASSPGTTAAGDTVTLVPGTYNDDPIGSSTAEDSWYDCASANPPATAVGSPSPPAGCTPITPAPLSTTYVVTSADQGSYITVFETDAAAVLAGDQTNQAASNPLEVLPPPPPPPPPAPVDQIPPSIQGASTSGSTVTAISGKWSGTGSMSYAYSWQRCNSSGTGCVPRAGNSHTLKLTSSDVGGYLLLTQTASVSNAGGTTTASANSPLFGPITTPALVIPPPNPPGAGTAVPTVSGTSQVGATLTAAPVTMSNNPSYAYQWLRCPSQSCTAIPGATSTTYSPSAADLGDTLAFSETATNAGGSGQAQSAKTAAVTAPTETTIQITPSGVVAGQTATLIATVTSATGQAPPMGAITFEQAGAAIPGCASVVTHPAGASATVTCQTTFAGSSSTLSAVFTPAPGSQVTGSGSTAVGFLLGRAASTAAVALPSRVTLGKRLTMTATIDPQAGTTGVSPTGDVVFLDGKKAIKGCTSTLANGIAHCAVTYKVLGKHAISAVYLGDANFSGSSTQPHTLAVVVAKPTGFVSSLMTWTFAFKPRYTRVTTLTVTGVQPGLTISVDCAGSGCPKHRYVDTVTRAACGKHDTCKNVNLAKRFAGRKLGVGATLTVRLTHRRVAGQVLLVRRPPRAQAADQYRLPRGRPGQAGRRLHASVNPRSEDRSAQPAALAAHPIRTAHVDRTARLATRVRRVGVTGRR